ncbi:hypothetical protein CA13_65640 [Planctomycetes bacterium CA13]|uniref:Uncharacterized protein n=1 Tax=Novipirellula herctigrandis TaxID=2527986 RepID=A0A5C5ZCN3_9BACT|nr:hypothetical protein CA13_65640 [Planctomycetes bacterium CA13]
MKRRTMGCNGGRDPSLFEVESRSRGPAEPYCYHTPGDCCSAIGALLMFSFVWSTTSFVAFKLGPR